MPDLSFTDYLRAMNGPEYPGHCKEDWGSISGDAKHFFFVPPVLRNDYTTHPVPVCGMSDAFAFECNEFDLKQTGLSHLHSGLQIYTSLFRTALPFL